MIDQCPLVKLCARAIGVCAVLFGLMYFVKQEIGFALFVLAISAIFSLPSLFMCNPSNVRFFCGYTCFGVNFITFVTGMITHNYEASVPLYLCAGALSAIFHDQKLVRFSFLSSACLFPIQCLALSLKTGGWIGEPVVLMECELSILISFFLILKGVESGNFYLEQAEKNQEEAQHLLEKVNRHQEEVESMLHQQDQVLSKMDEVATQVSAEAETLSAQSDELTNNSQEQTASMEQLNRSMDRMTQGIRETAHQLQEVRRESEVMRQHVDTGHHHMNEMLQAVDAIRDSSLSIEKIIKTIEDIAFQTNILALNAAVEAARAGNAGKGFAVVADEVRGLASRSAQAAQSTNELIALCLDAIQHGHQVADETARALDGIKTRVQDVTHRTVQISEMTQSQTTMVEEIQHELGAVSQVIQRNSAFAQQNVMSIQSLSKQSALLHQLSRKTVK